MTEGAAPFDVVGFIMAAEQGEIDDRDEYVAGMQELIDRGVIFGLQGSWQRAAAALIESGECTNPHRRQA